ncbi:MAG: TRAM domain-containing protein [Candidatus Saccharimonadales bacterium]
MELTEVKITKLVHGGQGLGELPDGRKVFVWNGLPGETVRVRIIKTKKSFAEAIAEEVVVASPVRVEAQESNYLATSPWQIVNFEAENEYKKDIVTECFAHEKVVLPVTGSVIHDARQWNYRNKMEYSFWGDDDGLHLALHQRGSHGKQIVTGSRLAMPALDAAADAIVKQLSDMGARAGDLKTLIVRTSQSGEAVVALYTKLQQFSRLELPKTIKGLRVYHSNPRSPASVPTALIYELGNTMLSDELLDQTFHYDVDSFFQVNPPVFELALQSIKSHVTEASITDLYAGVGTIGLSVASSSVDLVELDSATAHMAAENAARSHISSSVVETSAEKALEYITSDKPVIVDPPRAGLHPSVTAHLLDVLPPKIVYLSCNPATHARDLALLQAKYTITDFQIFNFFPRTPHIETLAILELNK